MIEDAVFCDCCKAPLLTKNGRILTNPSSFSIDFLSKSDGWKIVKCKLENDLKLGIITILCPNCSEKRSKSQIKKEISDIKLKIKDMAIDQYERKIILGAKHHVLGYFRICKLMREKHRVANTIRELHLRLDDLYNQIKEIDDEEQSK